MDDPIGHAAGYKPAKHKAMKAIEQQVKSEMEMELQKPRIPWKTTVHVLNCTRAIATIYRGERWIQHIWRETQLSYYELFNANKINGVI